MRTIISDIDIYLAENNASSDCQVNKSANYEKQNLFFNSTYYGLCLRVLFLMLFFKLLLIKSLILSFSLHILSTIFRK